MENEQKEWRKQAYVDLAAIEECSNELDTIIVMIEHAIAYHDFELYRRALALWLVEEGPE